MRTSLNPISFVSATLLVGGLVLFAGCAVDAGEGAQESTGATGATSEALTTSQCVANDTKCVETCDKLPLSQGGGARQTCLNECATTLKSCEAPPSGGGGGGPTPSCAQQLTTCGTECTHPGTAAWNTCEAGCRSAYDRCIDYPGAY